MTFSEKSVMKFFLYVKRSTGFTWFRNGEEIKSHSFRAGFFLATCPMALIRDSSIYCSIKLRQYTIKKRVMSEEINVFLGSAQRIILLTDNIPCAPSIFEWYINKNKQFIVN